MPVSPPEMSEAATPMTRDGFKFLSTTMKDNYDNDRIQKFPSQI